MLAGRPQPQFVASTGPLHLYVPVAQNVLTAVGYHAGREGALDLEPLGRQGNEGLLSRLWHRVVGSSENDLVWYQLGGSSGPSTSALDVGAPAGTDVYAPVDATVVAISDFVLDEPRLRRPDRPSPVERAVARRLADAGPARPGARGRLDGRGGHLEARHDRRPSGVERQALARYTRDAGNNVSLEVHPAATLSLP